jgi:TPP-dependent trihydroxycyclohexane-1,2-dione (THcHDO) dehydratase
MEVSKLLTVRLFFNLSDRTMYIQIGDGMYFRVSDKIAAAISSKEQIEIVHAENLKDMQLKSNEQ